MKLWFAVFLGVVQGATEFLPVSSSGHLSILQNIFGLEQNNLLFDVLLHLGTLIAVCVAYRKDIADMLRALVQLCTGSGRRSAVPSAGDAAKSRGASRLILLLIIGTLPLFAAVFVNKYVETLYNSIGFIGFMLIVTGSLLYISDKFLKGAKNEKNATLGNALMVGLLQAVAILPGLSRSGSTISAGIFQGFDREFAVKYSFLLSIPAVIGANILTFADALKAGVDTAMIPAYLAGVAAAAVSGYAAIALVKKIAKKEKFGGFAYYCWAVGLIVIVLSFVV